MSSPGTKQVLIDPVWGKKVRDWLEANWQHCPHCGTVKVNMGGFVSLSVAPRPNELILGGPSMPAFAVVCSNDKCGVITLINLLSVGLMPGGTSLFESDDK